MMSYIVIMIFIVIYIVIQTNLYKRRCRGQYVCDYKLVDIRHDICLVHTHKYIDSFQYNLKLLLPAPTRPCPTCLCKINLCSNPHNYISGACFLPML